jgi:hypothetical protein
MSFLDRSEMNDELRAVERRLEEFYRGRRPLHDPEFGDLKEQRAELRHLMGLR